MELGRAVLRRNGINNLQNALHPQHGLLWTDGKGIYLAPVHLYRDQVENAGSTRLGEFDYVQSMHWSTSLEDDSCYMAAVHQQTVTVWHVSGAVPRLAFKQVRKINVQPVPQGCLWNPKSDVLCLVSRQQCSFYFQHRHSRGSFAFPSLEHEKISCGCWLPDGKKLVVCVGSALLIYAWADVGGNISDFITAAWRLPGISGIITAVAPGSGRTVVCASDLPLKTLCTNNNVDTFTMPEIGSAQLGSDDIIRPNGSLSVKDSLLNLQPTPKVQVQDSAMVSVVQLRSSSQDPALLTSVRVPGLLSPDVVHFQVESQCVVVGSNSQCSLQVFALLDNHLLPAAHIELEKDERPKGICSTSLTQQTSAAGVLVLLGKTPPSDPTFLSGSTSASSSMSLKFFQTRPEKNRQLPNGHALTALSSSSTSLMKSESLREPRPKSGGGSHRHTRQASYKGERPDHRFRSPERGSSSELRIQLSARISSGEVHPKLVEEIMDSPRRLVEEVDSEYSQNSSSRDLEIVRADFSQTAPQFQNSKLSEQYEMGQRSTIDGTESSTTSVSPVTPKLDGCAVVSQQNLNRQQEKQSDLKTAHSNGKQDVTRAKELESVDSVGSGVCSYKASTSVTSSSRLAGPVLEQCGRQSTDDGGSVCSSLTSGSSQYEALEKQIQTQKDQIDALQQRLQNLSEMVAETTCVFPVRYQKMTEPEFVSIQCMVGGARMSRKFLLDNGRLQLDPVKQAFGLLTVELILDGEPVVLGSNVDGYIPMKFSAGSHLKVTGIPIKYSPQFVHKTSHKEADKL